MRISCVQYLTSMIQYDYTMAIADNSPPRQVAPRRLHHERDPKNPGSKRSSQLHHR
jgi:hypothetical protein